MGKNKSKIKQKQPESGYVISEEKPAWLDEESIQKVKEENSAKIRTFFQEHCPVKGISARGRSLVEYGWSDTALLSNLMNKPFGSQLPFYYANSLDDMHCSLKNANLLNDFPNSNFAETVCICHSKKDRLEKLFSHMRNSFAHSRFAIRQNNGDCFFIFEDSWLDKKTQPAIHKVSARMILRQRTLLKWIEIIEGGEKEFIEQNFPRARLCSPAEGVPERPYGSGGMKRKRKGGTADLPQGR